MRHSEIRSTCKIKRRKVGDARKRFAIGIKFEEKQALHSKKLKACFLFSLNEVYGLEYRVY